MKAYRAALRLARDDHFRCAEILYKRAWANERAGMLSRALRDLTSGIRLLGGENTAEATGVLAQLESLRAMVYFAQDRPGKALSAAQKAAATARHSDAKEALIRSLNVLELANLELRGPGDT